MPQPAGMPQHGCGMVGLVRVQCYVRPGHPAAPLRRGFQLKRYLPKPVEQRPCRPRYLQTNRPDVCFYAR
jgi:hypothetical protein